MGILNRPGYRWRWRATGLRNRKRGRIPTRLWNMIRISGRSWFIYFTESWPRLPWCWGWSGIAIPGIAYAGLTVRYSILKHANLGKTVVIETVGMQVLLIMIDWVLGYEGWSVNYAVPATILFADVAVVFLILVNRLNWQSYFMYQLAITIFSFIPLILWAAGLVTKPLMALITVVLTVFILAMTIFLGDRGVKNELIRRFHL